MKKYLIAIVIAFGALFGSSVQAAPLTDNPQQFKAKSRSKTQRRRSTIVMAVAS